MPRFLALAAASLVCFYLTASGASSEIYRWVDESGHQHLTNQLSEVPPEYRDQALADAQSRKGGGSVSHFDEDDAALSSSTAPEEPIPAAANGSVTRGGHDEDWWRAQSMERQRQIEQAESALEIAREEEENTSDIYFAPGAKRGPRRPARAAALSGDYEDEPTIAELEAELGRARRDFESFEDRARRADVPPGWLR